MPVGGLSPKERREVELELALKRAARSEAKCEEVKKALWACRARAEKLEDGLLDAISEKTPLSASSHREEHFGDNEGIRRQLRTAEEKSKRSTDKVSALRRQLEEERAENARLNRSTSETIAQLEADIVKLQRRANKATADCETVRRERTKLSKRLAESEADKRSIRIELDDARKSIHALERRDRLLAYGDKSKTSKSILVDTHSIAPNTASIKQKKQRAPDDDTTTDAERPKGITTTHLSSSDITINEENDDTISQTILSSSLGSASKRVSFSGQTGSQRLSTSGKRNPVTESSAQRAAKALHLRDAEQRYDEARRETEAEAKRLATDREILKGQIQSAQDALQKSQSEKDELARRNAELDIAAAHSDREKSQLSRQVSELEARITALQADRDGLSDRCRSLSVARDLAIEESSALKRNSRNASQAEDAAVVALKARCTALQEEAATAKQSHQEIVKLRSALAEARTQLVETRSQLSAEKAQTPVRIRDSPTIRDDEARASLLELRADLQRVAETVQSLASTSPAHGIASTPPLSARNKEHELEAAVVSSDAALRAQLDAIAARNVALEAERNAAIASATKSREQCALLEKERGQTSSDTVLTLTREVADIKAQRDALQVQLNSEIKATADKLVALSAERDQLKAQLESVRVDEEKARSLSATAHTKAQLAEANETAALDRLAKLEASKSENVLALTAQLAALKAQQPVTSPDYDLRNEYEALKVEVEGLRKPKQEQTATQEEVVALRAECETLKEKVAALESEKLREMTAAKKSANNRFIALEAERKHAEDEARSAREQCTALEARLKSMADLEARNQALEVELKARHNDRLDTDRRDDADEEITKLKHDLEEAQRALNERPSISSETVSMQEERDKAVREAHTAQLSATTALSTMQREHDRLNEKFDQARQAHTQLQKEHEAALMRQRELEEKLETLRENENGASSEQNEKLRASDEKVRALEGQLETFRKSDDGTRSQQDEKLRASEAKVRALRKELETIRKREDTMRTQQKEKIDTGDAKIRALEEELEASKATERKLHGLCKAASTRGQCAEINEANAQERVRKLEAELDETRDELAKVTASKSTPIKSSALSRERDAALEQKEVAFREARQVGLERDRVIGQRDELAQLLSQREAELEHLRLEVREAKARSEGRFESTMKERDSSVLRAEAALARVTAAAESLETEKQKLETEKEELEARCHDLEQSQRPAPIAELQALTSERDAAINRAEIAEADYKSLIKQYKTNDDTGKLRESLQKSEQRANSLNTEVSNLRHNLAELEYRAESAEADYKALLSSSSKQKQQSNPDVEALRGALAEANRRAEAAEEKLKQRSSRLSELREKVDGRRKETDSDSALVAAKQNKELRDALRQLDELQGEHAAAKLQVAQLSAELDENRHALKKALKQQQSGTPSTPVSAGGGGGFFGSRRRSG